MKSLENTKNGMNDMEGRKPGPTSIKVKLEHGMDDFKEINSPIDLNHFKVSSCRFKITWVGV